MYRIRQTIALCALLGTSACEESDPLTFTTADTALEDSASAPNSPAFPGPIIYGLTATNTLIAFDPNQANQVGSEVMITASTSTTALRPSIPR